MSIDFLRLVFDMGLVVLIWLVQLVIYPSFSYLSKQELILWHEKYTIRIGCVVMPLMLSQLVLAIIQFSRKPELYSSASLVLITLVWSSTFLQFVPIHKKISNRRIDKKLLNKLVKLNWIRTSLWTIIFLWTLYKCIDHT
ncbi:hypothetical protein GCM10022393_32050 [Aquimarina addita]|uniref:DUF4149 domain-containing protein n=1 Tax=Aquimarina addita TaxID=870485 RepID=A0ABP6UPQ3_9FLAO